jgi:predicted MFS family arabinose efflux permease
MAPNLTPPGQESDRVKAGLVQEYWQAIRSFSPSLQRFLFSMSLTLFTAFGLQPVLQNLYLLRLGFDVQFIGLLAGVGQIVWAVAAVPSGMLGNRMGLRNSQLLGCALFALGMALLLTVGSVPASQWRTWLIISQVIFWCGVALLTVNGAPYIMAVTNERERRHAFSVYAATTPTVAFVGSLIGGALPELLANRFGFSLDQPDPYRLALWPGVILACGAIAILYAADPADVPRPESRERNNAQMPLIRLAFIGLLALLSSLGGGALRTFFNVYLDSGLGMTPSTIGSVLGLAQLLPIGAALVVPLLAHRLGIGYAVLASLAATAVFLAGLAATTLVWVVILMYIFVVAAQTIANTTRGIFGQEIFSARWRTSSQSISVVGGALGWAIAGIGGGALIQASGFTMLYLACALAALLAAGLLYGYLRLVDGQPVAAVEAPTPAAEEMPIH